MLIKDVPIDEIKPYPNNPRAINANAIQQVAGSIQEYGWQQPIVLDVEGVIIVGHTRYAAAQHLGLPSIPAFIAEHLSPQQAAAYRLADNRTNEITAWDLDALTAEIDALAKQAVDVDFTIPGFQPKELVAMLELAAPPAPQEMPAPRPAPLPSTARETGRIYPPDSDTDSMEQRTYTAPNNVRTSSADWYMHNSIIARAMGIR